MLKNKSHGFIKLAPYVKFKIDDNHILQIGSGTLHFSVTKLIQKFLQTAKYLKEGIIRSEFDAILNTESIELRELMHEFIQQKAFFLNHDYDKHARYSRHCLYFNLVHPDADPLVIQEKIKQSKVVILGCGGIGNLMSTQLAAAGVGNITLVDDDIIEESNLTRQIIFNESDIGKKKVDVLEKKLMALNAKINIRKHATKINSTSDLAAFEQNDLIVVSADKPANIILMVNEYSKTSGVAFINVGYIQDIGVYGPLVTSGKSDTFSQGLKKYVHQKNAHVYSDEIQHLNKDLQAPSFGPLNMLVTGFAASEILKYLGGIQAFNSLHHRIGIYPEQLMFEKQLFE